MNSIRTFLPNVRIEVRDSEIVVRLPSAGYSVTYHKPTDSPQLLAKNFPTSLDSRTPMTHAEFLTRARQAANDKARELGWIV
jgi:hypothetical protein